MSFIDDIFAPGNEGQLNRLRRQATRTGKAEVAPFDPLQTQGQETVLGAVPQQQDLATAALGANKFLLGDALYPGTNPALQQTIDYATQPIMNQFLENILPAIRGGAETTGQFGGSRRANIEARAASDVENNMLGASSALANEGYQTGVRALMAGLGLTPVTQSTLETPGLTQSGVGDVRQQQEQNVLNANTANQTAKAASAAQQYAMTPQEPSMFQKIAGLTSTIAPFFA